MITDLGVLRPDPETKELTLTALHPGATVEQAKEATGWDSRWRQNWRRPIHRPRGSSAILRDLKARTEAARKKD